MYALKCLAIYNELPEERQWAEIFSAELGTSLLEEVGDFRDVFSEGQTDHSLCEGVMHDINTTSDPPFGPIYNLSQVELKVL